MARTPFACMLPSLLLLLGLQVQAQTFSTSPFEVSASQVAPKYRGHDAEALIKALKQVHGISPKGEFESTAQYEERIGKARGQKLIGEVSLGDTIAILLPPRTGIAEYDADRGILTFKWRPDSWVGDVKERRANLTKKLAETGTDSRARLDAMTKATTSLREAFVSEQKKIVGSYVGSNAFNRKTIVQKVAAKETDVIFPGGGRLDCVLEKLDLPADAAKSAKENLGVMLVGAPDGHFVQQWTQRTAPDMSSPIEEERVKTAIQIDLTGGVWLINRQTGDVLRKAAFRDDRECISVAGDYTFRR